LEAAFTLQEFTTGGCEMLRSLALAILLANSTLCAEAQTLTSITAPTVAGSDQGANPSLQSLVTIKRDTPVELMAYSEVSTADSTPGKRFKLLLNQPITVAGKIIAPKGSLAYGEVTSAVDSGGLGKSGRMTAKLLYLKLGDAEIPLEGETSEKGTGAGSAGLAILFTGWAGFFHRGNNAKIKAGEILTGYIAEDVPLDVSSTPIKRASMLQAPQQ
jgi:hypothetical protein